jgi:hypothetical protein
MIKGKIIQKTIILKSSQRDRALIQDKPEPSSSKKRNLTHYLCLTAMVPTENG